MVAKTVLLLPQEKHESGQGCTHAVAKMKPSVMFGEQYHHQIPVKWGYIFNVKGGSVEGTYHLPGVCQMPSAATHVKKTIVLSLPLYLLLLL